MARRYSLGASKTVKRAMRKRKSGTLKSGRSGKKVTSREQAIAIGLSEARRAGKKVPRKSAKKSSAKKSSAKKTVRKTTERKKTASRKTSAKKSSAKKTARKRSSGRKAAGKKSSRR